MKVVKQAGEHEVPRGVIGGAEISQASAGATNIYMGVFRVPPGARSRPHYHANCESAVYILGGRLEVRWGDRLENVVTLEPTDLVYVPPRATPPRRTRSRSPGRRACSSNAARSSSLRSSRRPARRGRRRAGRPPRRP